MWCPGCIILRVCERTYLIGSCIKLLKVWKRPYFSELRLSKQSRSLLQTRPLFLQHQMWNSDDVFQMTFKCWSYYDLQNTQFYVPGCNSLSLCWSENAIDVLLDLKLLQNEELSVWHLKVTWSIAFSNYTHTGLIVKVQVLPVTGY
jgi:hypothetical protein